MEYPKQILHWVDNQEAPPADGQFFDKINPATAEVLAQVARGTSEDVVLALDSAVRGHEVWSRMSVIVRADMLREAALLMRERSDEIADIIARESAKPKKDAVAEAGGAFECGMFFAGEGRRFFGTTLQSSAPGRSVQMERESIGVGALITPYNNPIANVAWKAFPALLCGNAVVMKAHEYTPLVPIWFAHILRDVGVPAGVFSVVQGLGPEAGAALVADKRVSFISMTGSTKTGAEIIKSSADRLAKVSIEAGGKNAFVVADDADLERAATIAIQSAFVDAGQRCASATRMIVFENVYEEFKRLFLEKVSALSVGIRDEDDFGAIVSERRLEQILSSVEGAIARGARLLAGGKRIDRDGFFMEPTVLENVAVEDALSCEELFGPVVNLYSVKNLEEAIELTNASDYKLIAAIHTMQIERAEKFIRRAHTGVVRVNGPTFGSEPHMPFGGPGLSGNGWREPGPTALDFYSEWKQVSVE